MASLLTYHMICMYGININH